MNSTKNNLEKIENIHKYFYEKVWNIEYKPLMHHEKIDILRTANIKIKNHSCYLGEDITIFSMIYSENSKKFEDIFFSSKKSDLYILAFVIANYLHATKEMIKEGLKDLNLN